MASYREHLSFSSVLGAVYGSVSAWWWHMDWGEACLGAGLTALGGVLPDLDSDSGIPIRELFGLAAAITPLLLFRRLLGADFSTEQTLALVGLIYLFIRYGLSAWFKRFTVHRGMFHSIPAMFIFGLFVYLSYDSPEQRIRIFLAVGVMLGFLSHLVLDEIYSVDLLGFRLKLNKYAGSALKFYSSSWPASLVCYFLLFALGFLALTEGASSNHSAVTKSKVEQQPNIRQISSPPTQQPPDN